MLVNSSLPGPPVANFTVRTDMVDLLPFIPGCDWFPECTNSTVLAGQMGVAMLQLILFALSLAGNVFIELLMLQTFRSYIYRLFPCCSLFRPRLFRHEEAIIRHQHEYKKRRRLVQSSLAVGNIAVCVALIMESFFFYIDKSVPSSAGVLIWSLISLSFCGILGIHFMLSVIYLQLCLMPLRYANVIPMPRRITTVGIWLFSVMFTIASISFRFIPTDNQRDETLANMFMGITAILIGGFIVVSKAVFIAKCVKSRGFRETYKLTASDGPGKFSLVITQFFRVFVTFLLLIYSLATVPFKKGCLECICCMSQGLPYRLISLVYTLSRPFLIGIVFLGELRFKKQRRRLFDQSRENSLRITISSQQVNMSMFTEPSFTSSGAIAQGSPANRPKHRSILKLETPTPSSTCGAANIRFNIDDNSPPGQIQREKVVGPRRKYKNSLNLTPEECGYEIFDSDGYREADVFEGRFREQSKRSVSFDMNASDSILEIPSKFNRNSSLLRKRSLQPKMAYYNDITVDEEVAVSNKKRTDVNDNWIALSQIEFKHSQFASRKISSTNSYTSDHFYSPTGERLHGPYSSHFETDGSPFASPGRKMSFFKSLQSSSSRRASREHVTSFFAKVRYSLTPSCIESEGDDDIYDLVTWIDDTPLSAHEDCEGSQHQQLPSSENLSTRPKRRTFGISADYSKNDMPRRSIQWANLRMKELARKFSLP